MAKPIPLYGSLPALFSTEFRNWQQVVSLTEVLDRLDEALNAMRQTDIREPRILLGQECPFRPPVPSWSAPFQQAVSAFLVQCVWNIRWSQIYSTVPII